MHFYVESVVSVPSSIQVGVPATLTCGSASGTGEEVQWLNATGHVLDSAPGVANLSLPLSPAQVMDNGTVLACRVSNHVTTLVLISVLGNWQSSKGCRTIVHHFQGA